MVYTAISRARTCSEIYLILSNNAIDKTNDLNLFEKTLVTHTLERCDTLYYETHGPGFFEYLPNISLLYFLNQYIKKTSKLNCNSPTFFFLFIFFSSSLYFPFYSLGFFQSSLPKITSFPSLS
jgi:hypothetical protein